MAGIKLDVEGEGTVAGEDEVDAGKFYTMSKNHGKVLTGFENLDWEKGFRVLLPLSLL